MTVFEALVIFGTPSTVIVASSPVLNGRQPQSHIFIGFRRVGQGRRAVGIVRRSRDRDLARGTSRLANQREPLGPVRIGQHTRGDTSICIVNGRGQPGQRRRRGAIAHIDRLPVSDPHFERDSAGQRIRGSDRIGSLHLKSVPGSEL